MGIGKSVRANRWKEAGTVVARLELNDTNHF
jgi:hypothetical protein